MKIKSLIVALLLASSACSVSATVAERRHLQSIEIGPWGFAFLPFYTSVNAPYSGYAGAGFQERISIVKRVMPTRDKSFKAETERKSRLSVEKDTTTLLMAERLIQDEDRRTDRQYAKYQVGFNRMSALITNGLVWCKAHSKGQMDDGIEGLTRDFKVLCENIAYIRKSGGGAMLENAKRREAYERLHQEMYKMQFRVLELGKIIMAYIDNPYIISNKFHISDNK